MECKGCKYLTFVLNRDLSIKYYVCVYHMQFKIRGEGELSILLNIVDEITKRCPFYFSREELEVKDEEK